MFRTVILSLVFKVVLDVALDQFVAEYFSAWYSSNLQFVPMTMSYVILTLISVLLHINVLAKNKPSQIVYIFYYTFIIVPMLSMYGLSSDYAAGSFVLMVSIAFFISITTNNALSKFAKLKIKLSLYWYQLFDIICVCILTYTFIYLFSHGGLQRFNLDLRRVYDVRGELSYSWPLIRYLFPWVAYVINMSGLVIGLKRKSTFLILLFVALQLLLFGMTNFKSYLLAPVAVVGIMVFSRKIKIFNLAMIGGILLVSLSYGLFELTGDILAPSMFIRRGLFVPAFLHYGYYDFFSKVTNEHLFLSNSILKSFMTYPYNDLFTRIIALEYIGKEANANVGYMGDAFAHFGQYGIYGFSIVLGIITNIIDRVSVNMPVSLTMGIIAMPSLALVNSGLLTVMLTHGMLFALLMLWRLSMLENRASIEREGTR